MILRAAAVAVTLALAMPASAQDIASEAEAARVALLDAITALEAASPGKDQVAALTRTIQAYERGLAAMREALRQATIRETALLLRFEAKRDRVSRLIGVLSGMDSDPSPLLLLHPSGPLGTARSGMMLAEVTPALQAEVEALRAELAEVAGLRALQASASETLQRGLTAAQTARTTLSQAIADRGPLPRRLTDDPDRLRVMIEDADTLDALASGLAPDLNTDGAMADFTTAQGRLPWPVMGQVLRGFQETDAAGIARPGLVIATRPQALVSAPWPGTIRYMGPFLDYGNVMILEPGPGYLLVLAGLGTMFGSVGEVVGAEAPLGLMGGADSTDVTGQDGRNGAGGNGTETLYMELRQGGQPVDPGDWFAETKE
jgi:murein hydrolase activator